MKSDMVVVQNTLTGEIGDIRRRLFESPVFNPNGLLIEVVDTRGGCVDCGTAQEAEHPVDDIEDIELYIPEEEED